MIHCKFINPRSVATGLVKIFLQCVVICLITPVSQAWEWQAPRGHLKYQLEATWFPTDSVSHALVGSSSDSHLLDNRWKFAATHKAWDFKLDYQLQARHSEQQTPTFMGLSNPAATSDDNRLFDLTHVLSDDEDDLWLHRIDRLYVSFAGEKTVARVGRQVVSWGNGLFFNPLDFFNPFDPTALDKEYKTGDDMLYGQFLFDSGADVQAVRVVRREPGNHKIRNDLSSSAIKYHSWLNDAELDVLIAQHLGDEIAGIGLVKSVGGSVWRGDLMLTKTNQNTYTSFVANTSYSWVWHNRNWNGSLEYFYNGFGLDDGYSLFDLTTETDLLQRLSRGELFTTGRHYLAANTAIEMTPLLILSPTVFINLSDQSAYMQVGGQYSLAQNWQLIAAINFPIGPKGTEYGGLDTGLISMGPMEMHIGNHGSVFLQLGVYF